jgi:ABC-type Mn2+/Zn2+ transport system ATPase subunit
VQLDKVAFRYRHRAPWVLRDVTLTVPRGRVIEVNGPNGAGKSTLLRLLAGVVPPVRGRVTGRPPSVGYAPERFPAGLDEPFAGLDTASRTALPALLGELAAGGTSIVVSDHQGDLRELPGIVRWQVTGHTVTTGDLPEEQTVVEVTVPLDEADTLVARLTADGYQARRR